MQPDLHRQPNNHAIYEEIIRDMHRFIQSGWFWSYLHTYIQKICASQTDPKIIKLNLNLVPDISVIATNAEQT